MKALEDDPETLIKIPNAILNGADIYKEWNERRVELLYGI